MWKRTYSRGRISSFLWKVSISVPFLFPNWLIWLWKWDILKLGHFVEKARGEKRNRNWISPILRPFEEIPNAITALSHPFWVISLNLEPFWTLLRTFSLISLTISRLIFVWKYQKSLFRTWLWFYSFFDILLRPGSRAIFIFQKRDTEISIFLLRNSGTKKTYGVFEMEYVLNHGMESSHRINNIQAKAEHTEQVKIENTELRLRVNDLETQLHDIQLKYEETKSRERNGFDWLLSEMCNVGCVFLGKKYWVGVCLSNLAKGNERKNKLIKSKGKRT